MNMIGDIGDIGKYEEYLGNPRRFIEEFCYITTKEGTFEKFKLNYPQEKLMRIVEENLRDKKPIRIRILKARQMGFSTLISALGFWWAAMNENSAYAVVAHKESSAQAIFSKNKMFYDNLPKAIKPKTDKFNSDVISFNDSNGTGLRSKIFFGTAGGGELFRGETILFLHKSEVAFWEDKMGTLKKSLNATVPLVPFSAIIDETTANGYNEYKDSWDNSVKGKDSYTPLFVGWQEMKEYRLKTPKGFELTDKELQLKFNHDLTDEQIYWRRRKIEDDFDGNEMWFQQEYPLSPEEAFIASGMGVFDSETIKEGYRGVEKPKRYKEIESVITNSKLMIWEEPEMVEEIEYHKKAEWNNELQKYEMVNTELVVGKSYRYANYTLGIDTSGMGEDVTQMCVWHNIKKERVARFEIKKMSEEYLAKIAVEIAKYYNNALIAPEVNFSHAICDYMIDEGYENLYITENLTRVDKKKESVQYGWQTTKASKAPMISSLRALLNNKPRAIRDKDFWYEAEYYILEDVSTNKMNAAKGHHDDIIIADAIGYYVSCSFQSKQIYSVSTHKKEEEKWKLPRFIGIDDSYLNISEHKKNKLKKGIYKNNA